MRTFFLGAFLALGLMIIPDNAFAYIGPGAGFAFISSFFILLSTLFLVGLILLLWPLRALLRLFTVKKPPGPASAKRVVVLGLDGLDPKLTQQYIKDGIMPNFSNLAQSGSFAPLQTTFPAMSPVAWSSFATGAPPSHHNIYDFLTRDPRSYLPLLSSVQTNNPTRYLNIGRYRIPLEKPAVKLMRKSQPFWKLLGEYGVFSTVLRVPITFPPEKFYGACLAGMCVPDLLGSQGTFTFYTSDPEDLRRLEGGVAIEVPKNGNRIDTYLQGPDNPFLREKIPLRLPLTIVLESDDTAVISLSSRDFKLSLGQYSPWVRLNFKSGVGLPVKGICRFYLKQVAPHFKLYMSPINIDPAKPALPVSYPFYYSVYLSKLQGDYATLGLAEDTWALNENVIDEEAFLKQCYLNHKEREDMFFNALDKNKNGVTVCVFDTSDRIQHMFMRYLTPGYSSNQDKDRNQYQEIIPEMYRKMDELLGRTLERVTSDDVLIVMSDHGFKSFARGVNLNSWFLQNGYLALKDNRADSEPWFADVDWSNTRAYCLGLGGIYFNVNGRESRGILDPKDVPALKQELIAKLSRLPDPETGGIAITEVFDLHSLYQGPYIDNAPDLLVGYNEGYRTSWDAAVGKVNNTVIEDNVKAWSGDHCIDPRLVPGVFFCNRPLKVSDPHITEIAPTVLDLFGIEAPAYMKGRNLVD